MNYIKSIVENNTTTAGRVFDIFIQILIVFSLVTYSIETIPNLTPVHREILRYSEIIVVLIFSLEYLLRVMVADSKMGYILSPFGIIDLLAIVPFYLSFGNYLRSLRILRILRLTRAFKMVRYNSAMRRFHRAILIAKEELILFSFLSLMLLFFAAAGIYHFEHDAQPESFSSIFTSMWWAVATLTTVGYGDIYPVTVGGRIFTFFILMVGLGMVAVPSGIIASAMSEARKHDSSIDKSNSDHTGIGVE